MTETWQISEEQSGLRLDVFLQEQLEDVTRSHIRKWIDDQDVLVNGKGQKAGYKLKKGDEILLEEPDPEPLMSADPEPMDLQIVYEDEDVAIVNKPQGMVVHPSAGHPNGTLVNGLMYHFQGRLSAINGVLRPGIVHRIDKDTSGLLVICKSDKAHQALSDRLKDHDITRRYQALVLGNLKEDEGTVDLPIGRASEDRKKMAIVRGGRRAVTHYRVLERFGALTFVELTLETGRTHQIRVHMKSLQHPVLGDPLYGPSQLPSDAARLLSSVKDQLGNGQFLHAKVLGFVHPVTGEYMEWESPLPENFRTVLESLRERSLNR